MLDPLHTLEDEFLGEEERPDPGEEYLEALAMLEQFGRKAVLLGEIATKVKVRPPSAVWWREQKWGKRRAVAFLDKGLRAQEEAS